MLVVLNQVDRLLSESAVDDGLTRFEAATDDAPALLAGLAEEEDSLLGVDDENEEGGGEERELLAVEAGDRLLLRQKGCR